MAVTPVKIGIIGGTGLDDPDLLENRQEKSVETCFGKPSDALITGQIKGVDCVLLARHGRKHTINPTNVNYRANLWALKEEGCTHVLVTTACGSLQENIHPGDMVVLDQFIDRTQKRNQTFYDGAPGSLPGVCHISMDMPFCPETRKMLTATMKELGMSFHATGTALTIEGPRFSSTAESKLWKSWGASIVNMTTIPEVMLAKEAGLCYAAIALVTDYDSWRDEVDHHGHANVVAIMKTLKENGDRGKQVLLNVIPKIGAKDWSTILKTTQDQAGAAVM